MADTSDALGIDDLDAPTGSSTAQLPDSSDDGEGYEPPPIAGGGFFLEASAAKVAKRIARIIRAQDKGMKSRLARWKVNQLRYDNIPGVMLVHTDPDKGSVQAYVPLDMEGLAPSLGRAATTLETILSHVYADPPVPECVPTRGYGDAPDRAEMQTRLLQALGGRDGYRDEDTAKMASLRAGLYGSGFRLYLVDETAGGHRPRSVQAHPTAPDPASPLVGHDGTTVGDPIGTSRDPEAIIAAHTAMTSDDDGDEPAPGTPPVNLRDANTPIPAVTRYVSTAPADGNGDEPVQSFVDDPADADLDWLPKLVIEIHDGRTVRLIPETARDITEAQGVIVMGYTSYGQLRDALPDVFAQLSPEQKRDMVTWRPENKEHFATASEAQSQHFQGPVDVTGDRNQPVTQLDADYEPDDSDLVFVRRYYCITTPYYPVGCRLVLAGKQVLLERDTWKMKDGSRRELPLDQFKQKDRAKSDPFGFGIMDDIGDLSMIEDHIFQVFLEHLDRFVKRLTFLPYTSILSEQQLAMPTGTVVRVNPGGAPTYEELPDFPAIATEMQANLTAAMQEKSGMTGAAEGVADPSIQSALHLSRVIEQVGVNLSWLKQGTEEGLTRGWKIQLQEISEGYTTEQLVDIPGPDGAYKAEAFMGEDIDPTMRVQVQVGSFTMLAPSAKMAIAEYASKLQLISPVKLGTIFRGNIGGLLGVQDDPAYLRIKAQLAKWLKGPPPGFVAPSYSPLPAAPGGFPALSEGETGPADPSRPFVHPPAFGGARPGAPDAAAGFAPATGSAPVAPVGGVPAGGPAGPSAPTLPATPASPQAGAPGAGAGPLPPPPAPANPLTTSAPTTNGPQLGDLPVGANLNDPATQLAVYGAQIFDVRPNDTDLQIATVRLYEISQIMSGTKYGTFPEAWQQILNDEYNRMFSVVYPPLPPAPNANPTSEFPVAGQGPGPVNVAGNGGKVIGNSPDGTSPVPKSNLSGAASGQGPAVTGSPRPPGLSHTS